MHLGKLLETYRDPLLVWLQAHNYTHHEAEHLVQGFFASLQRTDFLKQSSREQRRLRTFLLAALKSYLNDVRGKDSALKRGGCAAPDSLEETDDQGQPLHDPAAATPDVEYDRAWAQTVLAKALRQLETECAHNGNAALCASLEPVMFADETAAPYREIAGRLGMTEGAVAVAAHRLRARLRSIIREQSSRTDDNE